MTEIKFLVSEVEDSLLKDPIQGASRLLDLAMELANDNRLIHRALTLKRNLSEACTVSDREEVLAEMLKLASRLGEQSVAKKHQNISSHPGLTSIAINKRNRPFGKAIVCEGQGISKSFSKSSFSLDQLNFRIRLGEVTGVVGENGNGKTTLFRIITGQLAMDKGLISFPYIQKTAGILGVEWAALKSHIAFIPQDLERWYGSVKDNLHYELALHGIKGQENDDQVEYVIHRLGLQDHRQKTWAELSGGYKLRFALARVLAWKPRLLVIDEPLANLDIKAQLVILNDLRDLANSHRDPLAIVISSQHLHEIEAVSDTILLLKNGKCVFQGSIEDLGKERQENTFEFSSPMQSDQLELRLAGLTFYHLEHTGLAYVIRTPVGVSREDLMRKLLDGNVPIEYFRDISHSTKKLFI